MNAATEQPINWVRWLSGYFDEPDEATERLQWIDENCILVGAPAICPALPPCSAVQFNVVRINPELESYRVGSGDAEEDKDDRIDVSKGDRALRKTALFRLADAAGISWDEARSGRADDGRDPHCVHWHAAAGRRDLTGTSQLYNGDKQIDLREGSPRLLGVLDSVRETDRNGRTRTDQEIGKLQELAVRRARLDILEKAVSGAKCRAIREALGLRAYSWNELDLLFVVPRIVVTGRHPDPEIELAITMQFVAGFLAGGSALFGEAPARPKALAAPSVAPRLATPIANVSLGPAPTPERKPEPNTLDAEGAVVGCAYCGSIDGLEMVATKTGDVFVCADPECYDHAQGGVSAQGSERPRPPSNPPARPRSTPPPPPPASPSTTGSRSTGAARPAPPTPRAPSTATNGGAGRERTSGPRSGEVIPGGKQAGTAIEDVGDDQIKYWLRRLSDDLRAGTVLQRRGETLTEATRRSERLVNALRNELACRDGSVPH